LVSIHEDSGGVVVELAIEDDGRLAPDQLRQIKVALEAEARKAVEYQRQALMERETRLQLEGALRQSDAIIDKLILRPNQNFQGHYMGNTYNVPGQAGAVGDNAHAHDNTFNQIANHLGAALLERWLAAEKSGVAPNRQYQSGSCVVDMNCEIAYLTTKRNPLYDSLRCGSRTGSGKCLSVGSRAIQFYHHSTALRAGTTDDS
jgi:hypothetical protein